MFTLKQIGISTVMSGCSTRYPMGMSEEEWKSIPSGKKSNYVYNRVIWMLNSRYNIIKEG